MDPVLSREKTNLISLPSTPLFLSIHAASPLTRKNPS